MSGFLDKLREKSPEEKKKITIWAAAIITLVVALLWIMFFFPKSGGDAPAGSFLGNIKQSFSEITSKFNKK